MDYLVKYKDGFIIGASGDSPREAMAAAEQATARSEDSIDAITERHSTFVCFDSTRGWLARKSGTRKPDDVVDLGFGELIGVKLAEKPVEGVDLMLRDEPPNVPEGFTPLVDNPAAAANDPPEDSDGA